MSLNYDISWVHLEEKKNVGCDLRSRSETVRTKVYIGCRMTKREEVPILGLDSMRVDVPGTLPEGLVPGRRLESGTSGKRNDSPIYN